LLYEWDHSVGGHLTFLAGSYNLHVPQWAVFYIIANKISAFATVPAAMFVILALIQLVRFHLGGRQKAGAGSTSTSNANVQPIVVEAGSAQDTRVIAVHRIGAVGTGLAPALRHHGPDVGPIAFLLIWLLTTVGMFSLLNIVVGTHYLLPLAPPIVIAGTYTLAYLARYSMHKITHPLKTAAEARPESTSILTDSHPAQPHSEKRSHAPAWFTKHLPLKVRLALFLIIGVIFVTPHLLGLLNTAEAEGYTSEFFHGENQTLQVAYAGYREAILWLDTHTQGEKRIGLVALPQTLWRGDSNVSWFAYNSNVPKRFQIQEAHPKDTAYPYDYLVWPMHLVQRSYSLPQSWHIIQRITGGDTTYCFIATNSSSP
jgi:hypothetical protein